MVSPMMRLYSRLSCMNQMVERVFQKNSLLLDKDFFLSYFINENDFHYH
jgi:hypothetical protein